eukprot:Lithocolla_globosa_v1_NODE_477_length_3946_cov_89.942688.p2 type:complete len:155 gc:universal NODE_477_length_3946_cov_89.942688:2044-2508(+)
MSKIRELETKHKDHVNSNRAIYQDLVQTCLKEGTIGLKLSLRRATMLRDFFVYETNSEKKERAVKKKYNNIPTEFVEKVVASEVVKKIFEMVNEGVEVNNQSLLISDLEILHQKKKFSELGRWITKTFEINTDGREECVGMFTRIVCENLVGKQ